MCSWMVTAVIEHYNTKGRAVFGCAMDLSKAFDMVDWTELFSSLRERQVDPLFLRLLLIWFVLVKTVITGCWKP